MTIAGGIAAEHLRSFVERIERLEEEKKSIADDIKEVYAEAKANGFETKTIRQIVKIRKMDQDALDEQEALLDLYKAALGMLRGTALGEAAIRRITAATGKPAVPPSAGAPAATVADEPSGDEAASVPEHDGSDADPAPAFPPLPEDTTDIARAKGGAAARAGVSVTANPYPAHDPRRAAWDEAWCAASGSDGMEIPAFLRRNKKPAKPPANPAAAAEPAAVG